MTLDRTSNVSSTAGDTIPPRLFFRRLLAFLLDGFVAFTLAGFAAAILSLAAGVDLGAPGFVKVIDCRPATVDDPLRLSADQAWTKAGAGGERAFWRCERSVLGLSPKPVFLTEAFGKETDALQHGLVEVALDQGGAIQPMRPWPDLRLPLAIAIFGFFGAKGRRPPGKSILSLVVRHRDGTALSGRESLVREGVKFVPALVLFAWQGFESLRWAGGARDFDTAVAAAMQPLISPLTTGPAGLIVVFALIYWLAPFVAWRGQSLHDRAAESVVLSTRRR